MKVTYIGHSGFLVETKIANLLFDYFEGELPQLDVDFPLFVFASHAHHDHFNPDVLALANQYKNVTYVLSNDIKITDEMKDKYQLSSVFVEKQIIFVAPAIRRIIPVVMGDGEENHITMETIKSTDEGVAFLLRVCDRRIFHAGDLNCWVWEEDTVNQVNHMKTQYKRLIEKINGREIFLAMAPLDPRQGKYYKLSMDYLLNATMIHYAVPMHMWGQYEYIDRYMEERKTKDLPTQILKFSEPLTCMELCTE